VTLPPTGTENEPPIALRKRRSARWRWLGPVGLGLLGALAGLLLFTRLQADPEPITRADIQEAVATSIAKAAEGPTHATAVFNAILPSLVLIQTDGTADKAEGSGIGSGVIVRDDGMILTANHVIEGARVITVTFADGTESKAEVMEVYPNDLAVLRAAQGPELIVPAVLGGGVQVGDETFAVGNPLGLVASLSAGVVSALNRTITPSGGGAPLTGLIQFDAVVNPGSSGEPLLNRNGQVVGIVTALANPIKERSFTGVGFAVPLGTGGGPGGLPR